MKTTEWAFEFTSPLGPITVGSSRVGVCSLAFGSTGRVDPTGDPHGAGPALAAYFAGVPRPLHALPLDLGGTPFQQQVWALLRAIPYGQTTTYGALAEATGSLKRTRAVGRANGHNPVALAVPCHRVIGRSGHLVGYAGGLENKRWLLAHEGAPGFLVP
jgi:methylated-DNA-[protein]-cysteine S-methyltransferase